MQELRHLAPQNVEVLDIEAIVAYEGRTKEAAAATVARKLSGGAARCRLAEVQLRRGGTGSAVKSLTDWLDAHPKTTKAAKFWLNSTSRRDNPTEANTPYLRLAAPEPKNPVVQNNLAWILALLHVCSATALRRDRLNSWIPLARSCYRPKGPRRGWARLNWLGARPRIGLMSVTTSRRRLRLRVERREALSVLRQVLKDGDTIFAERDRAQMLLQRLGG